MKIVINGRQFRIGESLREHIELAIQQISEKYFANPIDASVTIVRDGSMIRADIAVHVGRRINIHSQGQSTDPYAAFDLAGEKIDKRLRRFKRRLRDHHRSDEEDGNGVDAQELVLAGEAPATADAAASDFEEWQPVIVAEMITRVNSLSVEEAVMHMDLADVPVLMFRNAGHGELNVVFRRTDGNIGWIDPMGSV